MNRAKTPITRLTWRIRLSVLACAISVPLAAFGFSTPSPSIVAGHDCQKSNGIENILNNADCNLSQARRLNIPGILTSNAFSYTGSYTLSGSNRIRQDGVDRTAATRIFTLTPSTHGNPEGIDYDPATGAFFVGGTHDGTIYRGTLDSSEVTEFIVHDPEEGLAAAGMKVFRGKLYVADPVNGTVRIYSISSGQLTASFGTGEGGFLNDLVVTPLGDVYITDSFRPVLWRITAEQVAAGEGTPTAIPLAPEIEYVYDPFPFNLNGIVSLKGGQQLVVVQSNTGKLFRIDIDRRAPNGREIHEIVLDEPLFGDGLLLDRGKLVVAEFFPVGLAFVKLDGNVQSGAVVGRSSDPALTDASTVTRARNYYLVVDPDFATNTPPFKVIGLPLSEMATKIGTHHTSLE